MRTDPRPSLRRRRPRPRDFHRRAAFHQPLQRSRPGLFRRRRNREFTTELSRLRNSFVIARNTAFTFKDKKLDAKAIGKELGVRYILEGSVQRNGNRVRVNAQLIDAESGAHLWADRFDEDVVDLFRLQDEVVARLARTLQIELINAEAQRSLHDRPQNPDAVGLTMRGWARFNQAFTKANRYAALGLFEQASTLDPANADALAGAAFVDAADYANGWYDRSPDLYARAVQRANQAILLDPDEARAHHQSAPDHVQSKAERCGVGERDHFRGEGITSLRPQFCRGLPPDGRRRGLARTPRAGDVGSQAGHEDQSAGLIYWRLVYGNG